jgi:hypothetical protein
MAPQLIIEVTENNGVSIREMYTLVDIEKEDPTIIDDNIYIGRLKEEEEKKMTKYEEIKNAIENGNHTAEELGMMVGNYLSSNAMTTESKLASEIEKEGVAMASFIGMIKDNESFSDDFKERCIKTITAELDFLEENLTEVVEKAEEVKQFLEDEEAKEKKWYIVKTTAKVVLAVASVVATAVTAYKIYRKFNPEIMTVDIDMPKMDI